MRALNAEFELFDAPRVPAEDWSEGTVLSGRGKSGGAGEITKIVGTKLRST